MKFLAIALLTLSHDSYAASASATIRITVVIPSFCHIQTRPVPEGAAAQASIQFRCNLRSPVTVLLEGTQSAFLSTTADCENPQTQVTFPIHLQTQQIYLCGVVEGEKPLMTLTVL